MSKRKPAVVERSAAIDVDGAKQVFVSPVLAKGQALSYLTSPLLELINSIYENYPKRAQDILRQHIDVNYELSEYERGLVKVAAKRVRSSEIMVERDFKTRLKAFQWVYDLVKSAREQLESSKIPMYERPRAIVCALFSHDHQLLVVESNQNARVKTEHAEMRFLKRLGSTRLDRGDYYFVTSLQSCRMCAGALKEWIDFQKKGRPDAIHIQVFYLEREKNLEHVETALSGLELHSSESRD